MQLICLSREFSGILMWLMAYQMGFENSWNSVILIHLFFPFIYFFRNVCCNISPESNLDLGFCDVWHKERHP